MKKTISVLLLLSTLTAQTSYANDFVCKEIYDKKIARLEKTSDIRRYGRMALYGIVGFAGMSSFRKLRTPRGEPTPFP